MFKQKSIFFKGIKIIAILTALTLSGYNQNYASVFLEDKEANSQTHVPHVYYSNLGILSQLPQEIIAEIFSYCIETTTKLNRASFTITTGYKAEDVFKKGTGTPPFYKTYLFLPYKLANFKMQAHLLQNIPSYIWYKRISQVHSITKQYLPSLRGTAVHTIDLSYNHIDIHEAKNFAQNLLDTNVHTVKFNFNNIGSFGAIEFIQGLQGTKVHTLYLDANSIDSTQAGDMGKFIQATRIHTIYLRCNNINGKGVIEFAEALQNTRKFMVYLQLNNIDKFTQELLKKKYAFIEWEF